MVVALYSFGTYKEVQRSALRADTIQQLDEAQRVWDGRKGTNVCFFLICTVFHFAVSLPIYGAMWLAKGTGLCFLLGMCLPAFFCGHGDAPNPETDHQQLGAISYQHTLAFAPAGGGEDLAGCPGIVLINWHAN